ncbi:MAG TPA: hypothetical protein VF511_06375, partial [Chthoniobacterales bacterium]
MNFSGSRRGAFFVGLVIVLTGPISASALGVVESRVATSSENNSGWLLLGAVVAAGIGGLVYYFDQQRSDKIGSVAASLGVPFRRKPRGSDEHLPIGCSLEHKGCDHVIANVLEAVRTDELVLTLF